MPLETLLHRQIKVSAKKQLHYLGANGGTNWEVDSKYFAQHLRNVSHSCECLISLCFSSHSLVCSLFSLHAAVILSLTICQLQSLFSSRSLVPKWQRPASIEVRQSRLLSPFSTRYNQTLSKDSLSFRSIALLSLLSPSFPKTNYKNAGSHCSVELIFKLHWVVHKGHTRKSFTLKSPEGVFKSNIQIYISNDKKNILLQAAGSLINWSLLFNSSWIKF